MRVGAYIMFIRLCVYTNLCKECCVHSTQYILCILEILSGI